MLLFNWNKVYSVSAGSSKKVVEIYHYLVEKPIPKNRYDKRYYWSKVDFVGENFLVGEKALYDNLHKYSNREVAEYLALAARRSLTDYLLTQNTKLDLLLVPQVIELSQNRLLRREGKWVTFKYEETFEEK